MCGIAGMVRFDGAAVDRERLQAMVTAMAHRGPDDEGLFAEGSASLGMRRLSIIDLSPAGHQPMASEDGQVQVVFNGEIYNFLDLRSRLLALGHAFKSRCDTEVLVHGYQQFGAVGLASRVEGMFAFAVLDLRKRRLFLVRDHFGVKPLYLRRHPGRLSFASEIRALAQDGTGSPGVDPSFVGSFLRLGYVPSPRTAFRGVTKLAPGTILEVALDSGEERTHRYYELAPAQLSAAEVDDDALLERLKEALNLSVRRQLRADVPVGVFLSGGLDSSTLSALAVRHATQRLQTFSIGYSRLDREDETRYAASVARRLDCANVAIRLQPGALRDLGTIVESLEEPLADSAVISLWHLCRGTGAHVKVALSGEGGDEALGGYARYFWAPVAARLARSPAAFVSAVHGVAAATPLRSRGPLNVVRRAGKLADTAHLPEADRYLSWFDVFTAAERASLLPEGVDLARERVGQLFERAHQLGLDEVQRLQYVDFGTFLLDNLLMKSDKLSMAHGLEVRVPLLDRPLAELGIGLPVRAKISSGGGKVLLRRFVREELPRAIARRRKAGFEIPVDRWFRGEETSELRAGLSRGALVGSLGLSRQGIETVVARHLRGEDMGRKLFALLTLELWAGRYCG